MDMKKGKAILFVGMPLLISMAVILMALYFRSIFSGFSPELIQNTAYLLVLCSTFFFIKLGKRAWREVGLFSTHFARQITTGLLTAAAVLFVGGILTGWSSGPKENLPYLAVSQLLVAFTEELLFRGYLLTALRDMVKRPNTAVWISAFLFGLWHYPLTHNLRLVLVAFVIGAVYGTLRTIFEKTDDEIGILSLSIAHWAFNVIL